MGEDSQKCFAHVHEDGDVKNRVGIEVDKLNPIEKEESAQKTAAGNSKAMLKE